MYLSIKGLGGDKFVVMELLSLFLSPRIYDKDDKGGNEIWGGGGVSPLSPILIVISFSYNWRAPTPPPLV